MKFRLEFKRSNVYLTIFDEEKIICGDFCITMTSTKHWFTVKLSSYSFLLFYIGRPIQTAPGPFWQWAALAMCSRGFLLFIICYQPRRPMIRKDAIVYGACLPEGWGPRPGIFKYIFHLFFFFFFFIVLVVSFLNFQKPMRLLILNWNIYLHWSNQNWIGAVA